MAGRNLIGLDIGSRFIKALQLTNTNGQMVITEYGTAEVTPDVPLPDAIRGLITSKNFRTQRASFGVSGRSVFVRHVPMGVMSDQELANAAKYELGKYIPIEVDEVLHDCQRLEEPQPGAQEMRVVLVAARRAFLDERVGIVEQAHLVPHLVDVECFALGNAFEMAGTFNPDLPGKEKVVALVEVGASKSNVVILDNLLCVFTREFYKGGDDITDALAKKLDMPPPEAEALKREPAEKAQVIEQSIEDILEDIAQDVKISIDYFENQQDKQVDAIYVTGGSCGTPGLREGLERMAGKSVDIWNPLEGVPSELTSEAEAQMRQHAWQFPIALGLALRFE